MLCRYLQTHQRRVGRSLKQMHCKGNLVPSRKQVAHKSLGTKGSHLLPISTKGGMKSGSQCALLWRILSWCTRKQGTLKAHHIPHQLNVIADKLSRLGQTFQTEWSLNPEVFQAICSWWHQPQVDLFATRFNNKLTQFVLPVPDPQAWAVDALSLSWGKSGSICLSTSSHLGQSGEVTGLPLQQDNSDCTRVAQHALVLGSSGNVQSDPSVSA